MSVRFLPVVVLLALPMVASGADERFWRFWAPRGVFRPTPGTFTFQRDDFRITRGAFRVAPGTFQPTRGYVPVRDSFKVKPGTFAINEGQFKSRGDFRVKPGTFYIGRGFLTRK